MHGKRFESCSKIKIEVAGCIWLPLSNGYEVYDGNLGGHRLSKVEADFSIYLRFVFIPWQTEIYY